MVVLCLLGALVPTSASAQRPTRTPPPVNTVQPTETFNPTRTPIVVFGTPTRTSPGGARTSTPVNTPTRTANSLPPTRTPQPPTPTRTAAVPTPTRTSRFNLPTETETPEAEATPTEDLFDTATPTRTTRARTSTPRPATNTPGVDDTPPPDATNTRPKATNTRKPTSTPRPAQVTDISFRVGREFPVGDGPTSLAVADFDNDGLADAAVVSRQFNTMTILLGERNGPFKTGPDAPDTGREPVGVLALSLDGDPNIDLITAEATDGTVTTYFNNGDALFSVGQRLPTSGEPAALALFGTRIAVADRINSRVLVLRRDASGVLAIDDVIDTGAEPVAIAVGDVDADGRLDIVTADDVGASVTILLARNNGYERRTVDVMGVPNAVSLGDYDLDGQLDFVVSLPLANRIGVYHQEGGGFVRRFDREVAPRPSYVLLADDTSVSITADGVPDLLVLSAESSILYVFEGRRASNNPPAPFDLASTFTTGRGSVSLATANIDTDARFADLVVVNRDGGSVQVVRGAGGGGFVAPVTFDTGMGPVALAIGDFDWKVDCSEANSLCTNDVVTANLNAGTVSFLKGNGVGSVREAVHTNVLSAPSLMAVGDVTADGHDDLVLASSILGTAAIYKSEGDGTFTSPRQLDVAGSPRALGVGDVDGNLTLDLVLGWTIDEDSGVDVYADLLTSSSPRYSLPATGIPTQVAFGDINGDGLADVAALIPDRQEMDVWYQLQDGRFSAVSNFTTTVRPTQFVLADIDEDGELDAIIANHDDGSFGKMFGEGGGLRAPELVGLPDQPSGILAGDFNQDGAVDIALISDTSGRLTVYAGLGNGTFPRTSRFPAGVEPQIFAIGQINNDRGRGDERIDVVVADYPTDRITIFRNNTDVPPVVSTPSVTPTPTPRPAASGGGGGCELPSRNDGAFLLLIGAAVIVALIRAYSAEGGTRA